MTDEDDTEQQIAQALAQTSFECYKEGITTSCHDLGELYVRFKKDYHTARELFKRNCDDYKFSRSCFRYAELVDKPRYNAQDVEAALDYYARSCQTGNGLGCRIVGSKYVSRKHSQLDYTKALQFFEKGCDGMDDRCCFFASEMYRQGKVVPTDMPKAVDLAGKACEFGSGPGCVNAYNMLKRGDGVPQCDELAEKFKALGTGHIKAKFERERILNNPGYVPPEGARII